MQRYDTDRFTHEPRALWTVVRQAAADSEGNILAARVEVNKDHFRNVSRYPIVLTHALVCGINYVFRSYGPVTIDDVSDVQNCMAVQNLVDIFLSAPYTLHITSRDGRAMLSPGRGSAEPGMLYSTVSPDASGPFGISRWVFDRQLILPPKVDCTLDLSAMTLPGFFEEKDTAPTVRATVAFDEVSTDMLGGNDRLTDRMTLRWASDSVNAPFGTDGFGFFPAAQVLPSSQTWPTESRFRTKTYRRQESNRGQAHNRLTGFSVHIDQVAHDDYIVDWVAPFGDNPISPLSTRIATRARCANGGSGEWWWRSGAPLALVAPSCTPALVACLPEPIELGPGEQLDMELQFPAGPTIGQTMWLPAYQIGVSFTGYAVIEG